MTATLATLSGVHWFNETRLHDSIGHTPPAQYENEHHRQINARKNRSHD